MPDYLSVPNFERWQHYKNRRPPWIKLHSSLLNHFEFSCLQDASKLHLILIWVLASQLNNRIPDDPEFIQHAIHAREPVDLNELIDKGFLARLHDASKTLAERKQSAIVETYKEETETETETETEKEKRSSSNGTFDPVWKLYPRKDGKQQAQKSWAKLPVSVHATIMEDIKTRWPKTVAKADLKYIPHFSTYLNNRRWEDPLPEPVKNDEDIPDWQLHPKPGVGGII